VSAAVAGNPVPGGLTVVIADQRVDITMTGGGAWEIPLGAVTLCENELRRDPPRPAELTNALGFVHDYFDDIVVAEPTVLATPSVMATGHHAEALAHVEIGHTNVPAGYTMQRADADEVFRTLVAEPRDARLANPGLDARHVDTVIGVLCIVLAIMRRLDLGEIAINAG
jgi:exopolyphosphatase/pppGpp-phosphohydrolase